MESSVLTLVGAAVAGYLVGSLSGARIVGRRRAAGALERTKVVLDGTGASVEVHGVSASALQARQGARGGLPAGTIDIAKALLPVLVARLLWPDSAEHVVLAGAVLVGHVYPVYHRFVGVRIQQHGAQPPRVPVVRQGEKDAVVERLRERRIGRGSLSRLVLRRLL